MLASRELLSSGVCGSLTELYGGHSYISAGAAGQGIILFHFKGLSGDYSTSHDIFNGAPFGCVVFEEGLKTETSD